MDSHSGSTLATAFTLIADQETEQQLPSTQDLRAALEKGTDQLKLETLRRIVVATLNGQPQPNLLMPIIQFVLPSKNKHIKKLLQCVPFPQPSPHRTHRHSHSFYWEICPKLDENGKLKQEMILVWCAHSSYTTHRPARASPALSTDLPLLSSLSNAIRNDLVRSIPSLFSLPTLTLSHATATSQRVHQRGYSPIPPKDS